MYTTDEFKQKARNIHKDLYNYDKSYYKAARTKIEIVCSVHGSFFQTPDKHINGVQGCPTCAKQSRIFTLEEFIQRAIAVHGSKYDYSDTIYERVYKKVTIKCKIHGEFYQKPNSHLSGQGCLECSYNAKRTPVDILINKFNNIHHHRYDYSKMVYINNYTHIDIICDKHGIFSQTPSHHGRGSNCPKCVVTTKYSKKALTWLSDISEKENIRIICADNDGEYTIPNTRYKVDGFCIENNTIYEFYGNVFHGNLNIFEDNEKCHPYDRNITAHELFKVTMLREKIIKDKGYKIISIWEDVFDKTIIDI